MFSERILGKSDSPKRLIANVLLEILIIILGVLISLWISNIFQNKDDARQEGVYLELLRRDLQADLLNLQSERERRQEQAAAAQQLIRALNQPKAPNFRQTLASSIRSLLATVRFSSSNATFRALESTGELKLIREDSLVNQLIQLYSKDYESLRHNNDDISHFRDNFLLPYAVDNLNFRDAFGKPTSSEVEDVVILFNQAAYCSISLQSTVDAYQKCEERVEKLLDMLEGEL